MTLAIFIDATLETVRKPLQGATTTSDTSGSGIQIWAEILYKQPTNSTENSTLYQMDKQSLNRPDSPWDGWDEVDGQNHMSLSTLRAIFEEVNRALLEEVDGLSSLLAVCAWKHRGKPIIWVSGLPGTIDTFPPNTLLYTSNEPNAVENGNHWRREAPPVTGLKDPRGLKHIWNSLIMAFTHICKYYRPPFLLCQFSMFYIPSHND